MSPPTTNFAGNDYLGLARDPRLADAVCATVRSHGLSATSSRWALGWTDLHQQLEDALAAFTGAESACILGAAYFGGPVYYSAFAGTGRVVYCDETVHSNQFIGMRAAGLEIRTYRHLDVADLKRQLDHHRGPPPIVASDGVYGISGELAPLAELVAAARGVDAEIFIDDAHGFGAIGASGRGSIEACGLLPAMDLTVLCSMSKAMGCNGGFLCGRRDLIERLRRSAPASGSAIPPPPIAAACLEALRIIAGDPSLRQRMEANAQRMRATLLSHGIRTLSDRTPIIGMIFADETTAAAASSCFLRHGLVIPYFKYASEPRHNLLRGAARACYAEADLSRFADAVADLTRR